MATVRRRTLLLIVLVAVAVASAATWAAAARIRSPAEEAARMAAPEPTPILVPVVERVLTSRVVSRGTAHYGSPLQLSLSPSALKSGPRVVTTLPRPSSVVREGEVLLTVSGRPVFVLRGAQPSYRDLGPGMAGTDVLQVERALRRLGLRVGAVDGTYDEATGRAVATLYRRRGDEPVVASEEDLVAVRTREAELMAGARPGPGVQLPSDEVVFVRSTPLRVSELPVQVGAEPDGPVVTVTGSQVVVDGMLRAEQAGLVDPGARVRVDEPDLGISTHGTVRRVAARPGTDGADGFHVAFEIDVTDPPRGLVGASVRLTVPIRSTREAQLTVPVSAVSLAADGGPRVERSVGGRSEHVPVRLGLSVDGYVAVTPTRGGLAAGDRVVVGLDGGGRGRGR